MSERLPSAFLVSIALAALANSLWTTLFPIFLDERGFKLLEIGIASSLTFSLVFILAFPAGLISDWIPTRRALLASFSAQLASLYLMYAARDPVSIIALLVAYNFSLSLQGQASVKLVATVSRVGERAFKYSVYMMIVGVSRIIGSYLSGLIVNYWGFQSLFEISEILLMCSALIALGVSGGSMNRLPSLIEVRHLALRREVVLLVASLSLHDFAIFACLPYVALFMKNVVGLTVYEIGLLSAIRFAVTQAAQLLAGMFADRFGGTCSLALHYLGVSLGLALIGLSGSFTSLVVAAVVQGVFMPFDIPARRKLLSVMAPRNLISSLNGLADTVVGIATIPSPLIGNYIWYSTSPRLTMIYGASANLLALAPLVALRRVVECRAASGKMGVERL